MGRGRQNWRAFRPVMHLHENHYTKRAGVAGIRARAKYKIRLKVITVLKDNHTSSFTAELSLHYTH